MHGVTMKTYETYRRLSNIFWGKKLKQKFYKQKTINNIRINLQFEIKL